MSSSELDIQLKSLLHTPLWKQRVFYIHGSALRDIDLERAKYMLIKFEYKVKIEKTNKNSICFERVQQARAVFIIASRGLQFTNH